MIRSHSHCRRSAIAAAMFLLLFAAALPVAAQDRRRVLKTPGLVVETGAPTGEAQAVLFTADGKNLLVAGRDKVVRQWPLQAGRLDRDNASVLRWAIYREQRGVIYTAALSRDPQQKLVAVGGIGIRSGSMSIIDRASGKVVDGLMEPTTREVLAMCFTPDNSALLFGTSDGKVVLWNLKAKNQTRVLGQHGTGFNRVKLIVCPGPDRAYSFAEDGSAMRWQINANAPGRPVASVPIKQLIGMAASGDGTRFAFSGKHVDGSYCVVLRGPEGENERVLRFRSRTLPGSLALDGSGRKLAIGLKMLPQELQFHTPARGKVHLYDIARGEFETDDVPQPTYVVDALGFSPDGNYLAVAGGNDFELTLWDVRQGKLADQVRGPGNSIWSVRLSSDGSLVGFQDQRAADPKSLNAWGAGPPRLFDLKKHNWATVARMRDYNPAEPLATVGGWTIEIDLSDPRVWYAVNERTKKRHPLPLDKVYDGQPRCYTFLPATNNKPVRVVVGHEYGLSVIGLSDKDPPVRLRWFLGHQDAVYSVVASADQKILVSSSRDQTIAGWSLADWPNQPELGVSFQMQNGQVVVQDVATGSPGWEAGLSPGDRLRRFAYGGKWLTTGPAEWHRILLSPSPGNEMIFEVQRAGAAQPVPMLTRMMQRPLWRFFPTRDNQWVLWRWRDFYYDCSRNGDDYIGWQINEDVDKTPAFTRAEQNRNRFHDPEKVRQMLDKAFYAPERAAEPELVQPNVSLAVKPLGNDEFEVTVRAAGQADVLSADPDEVSLWVNEAKVFHWHNVVSPFEQRLRLTRKQLRGGDNVVLAQAYSTFGVRGDSKQQTLAVAAPPAKPRLFALCVGINEYGDARSSSARGGRWNNLTYAAGDAAAISQALEAQEKTGLYAEVHAMLLADREASRDAIVNSLRRTAETVAPDDVFVLFMSGHGWAKQNAPDTFSFVTPRFNVDDYSRTGLPFTRPQRGPGSRDDRDDTLYDLVVRIPCRKVVLLDCCHAGGAVDMIRRLAPERVGPVIVVSCDKDELAFELPTKGYGAFTAALIETFRDKFPEADRDRDGFISTKEMTAVVEQRVPKLLQLAMPVLVATGVAPGTQQRPQVFFPKEHHAYPLYGKK